MQIKIFHTKLCYHHRRNADAAKRKSVWIHERYHNMKRSHSIYCDLSKMFLFYIKLLLPKFEYFECDFKVQQLHHHIGNTVFDSVSKSSSIGVMGMIHDDRILSKDERILHVVIRQCSFEASLNLATLRTWTTETCFSSPHGLIFFKFSCVAGVQLVYNWCAKHTLYFIDFLKNVVFSLI